MLFRSDLTTNRDEVILHRLRQQRQRPDRGAAQIVADALVLSDVGDFIGDVLGSPLGSRRCSNGRVSGGYLQINIVKG